MKHMKKFCPDCNENLYLSAFQKNSSRGDGLQVYCRKCQNRRNRIIGLVDPHKVRAQAAVKQAIASGKMKRGTHCFACTATVNIDAHHEDYDEPLEVIWLCRSCHQKLHAEERGEA